MKSSLPAILINVSEEKHCFSTSPPNFGTAEIYRTNWTKDRVGAGH
jgi:hypothetical protein